MQKLINDAKNVANTFDVSTPKDCAVVYSVSYMPNEKNKELALEYLKNNSSAKILDRTPCGKALIDLGLHGKVNEIATEITNIWKIASTRFVTNASGNVVAFVDGADERSTFYSVELKEILKNPAITKINGIDKFVFAKNFTFTRY